ncbi:ABC transporter, permease protein [Actinomyces urogenitalis DSM 15434]|uniref:ABC transporter, permease protein n=2 Tax=Actinomyces urogenitalis TaxID=103621 RepID=C0W655_9ACTO|nr:carbohydrate ABC transporter permease [Actinomyces urogenitalis]EEH65749.1 ABC transporter, permease protein [Actinomyces urogenitalis DSM 15434]ETJ03910.1 MAG: Sugar ABC superfamily ATP binding cassette transporter, membrane protein [Actinomyces urogenitalis DORA_12]MBS6071325.1 carbohydrate ABC transporter permease [Actinomyces urogenitalis]MDU7428626.1 carbohydrate ABC transporter permease [Actinomyces urogenitalis]
MNQKFSPKVAPLVYGVLILFAVLFLYPILWLVINSFKTNAELFASPWSLPGSLSLENYYKAFTEGNIGRYFVNSVIVTGAVVIVATVLSAMAAYGLTRLRWRLSKLVLALFLLGLSIPMHAAVVPLFAMFNKLQIVNTYLAVIIPHVVFAMPIAILILTSFFSTIPHEVEEAAVMDGCSIWGVFFKIICPMAVPSLVTVAVITFINAWNDLLLPQIFLSDPEMMTLPVGLTAFQGRYSTDYVAMIAAVVITIIPTIVVYSLLHKKIISGMTAGAVKG